MNKRILIVEDETRQAKLWKARLQEEGYMVELASNGREACSKMLKESYHLVLTDIRMPQMDGLQLLDWIRERDKELLVIMITAYADVDSAVRAMKKGAYDYVRKPMDLDELTQIVGKVFKIKKLEEENIYLKTELSRKLGKLVVGESAAFKKVMDLIEKVSQTNATVLVYGETGTGKELVANTIHYNSSRSKNPLVVVNCAALPENLLESELFGHVKGAFTGAHENKKGKFSVADSGTMFLDEVGAIPLAIQPKLLRVIETQKFEPVGSTKTLSCDVRIIAATNVNLGEAVSKGNFREDLYYRLNVFPLYLPPLRDRKEDIPHLVEHFVEMYSSELRKGIKGVDKQALRTLNSYSWPGNVRELENIIERAIVLCEGDSLTYELFGSLRTQNKSEFSDEGISFPQAGKNYSDSKKKILASFDESFIKRVLAETNGNISMAAEISGIDRKNLYRKIKKLHIDPKKFRS